MGIYRLQLRDVEAFRVLGAGGTDHDFHILGGGDGSVHLQQARDAHEVVHAVIDGSMEDIRASALLTLYPAPGNQLLQRLPHRGTADPNSSASVGSLGSL